jgi:maltose O-acetyltransferase
MIAGAYYHSIDALIKKTADTLNLLHRLNVTEYRITKKAKEIIAELITNTGSNFYIEPPFHCDYGYNIVCGDNVYFNARCWILHLSL